jgi:hypothetical protein
MKSVGPRVAANFGKPQSVLPGAGRGILAIGSVPRLPNTFCEFLSFLNVFYLVIEDTYLFV